MTTQPTGQPTTGQPTTGQPTRQLTTTRDHRVAVGVTRAMGTVVLPAAFRLRVDGRALVPATGPVILASNHTGFLDGPLLYGTAPRPVTFLIKEEMFAGLLGAALRTLGQLPIRRRAADRTALLAALGELRAGGVVGVFPEGTRGSGEFRQVQHGIAFLALHSGAPIVPVHCHGTRDALPPGRLLPRLRAPVRVAYGEPFTVDPAGPPGARRTVTAAAEQIRTRLAEHAARSATAPTAARVRA